jgi:hypothetical protein
MTGSCGRAARLRACIQYCLPDEVTHNHRTSFESAPRLDLAAVVDDQRSDLRLKAQCMLRCMLGSLQTHTCQHEQQKAHSTTTSDLREEECEH